VRNSASVVAPGVDIRGEGGYALLPPSKGPNGVYEFALGDLVEIADLANAKTVNPVWLEEALTRQGAGRKQMPAAKRVALEEGSRNDGLFRLASRLRRSGLTVQEIAVVLANANQERCSPPLSDKEVASIVGSAVRYLPATPSIGPEAPDYHCTDSGNAELLRDLYGGKMRFMHTEGCWLIWRGNTWRRDETNYVMQAARKGARKRWDMVLSNQGMDEKARKAALNWAMNSEGSAAMERALHLLAAEPSVATVCTQWDADPDFLGLPGSGLDLHTLTQVPARPEQLVRRRAGTVPDAQCVAKRWHAFLSEIFLGDEGLIQFVQRLCGYSLLGRPIEQVWVLCQGRGANGKSVLLRALRDVFGDYAVLLPFSALEERQSSGVPNDLARLAGSRLAIASETTEGAAFDAARLKALTGGEKVTARFLHREFFDFDPQFVLWMAANQLPKVRDASEGFWRRALIVPFSRVLAPAERDPWLSQKLQAEYPHQ